MGGEQRGEGVRMKVGKGKDPFTTAQHASTRTPRKHPTPEEIRRVISVFTDNYV